MRALGAKLAVQRGGKAGVRRGAKAGVASVWAGLGFGLGSRVGARVRVFVSRATSALSMNSQTPSEARMRKRSRSSMRRVLTCGV